MNRKNQSPHSDSQAPKLVKPLLMPVLFLLDANLASAALQGINLDTLIQVIPLFLAGVLFLFLLTGLAFLQRRFLGRNQ